MNTLSQQIIENGETSKIVHFEAMPAADAQMIWLEHDFIREAVMPSNYGLASLMLRPNGMSNLLRVYAGVIPDGVKSRPSGNSVQEVWDLTDIKGFNVVYGNGQAHSLEVDDKPKEIDLSTLQTLHRLQRLTLDTTVSGPEQSYTVTKVGFLYIAENIGNSALGACLGQIHDTVFAGSKN